MPFLEKADYSTQIKQDQLETVLNNDDSIRLGAELAGQAEMESYLGTRYNVSEIFNKTAEDRNPLILMYLKDIVLYHIHSRANARNVPETREIRYNSAIEWLKMVSSGRLAPNLPAITAGQPSTRLVYGSWSRDQNYF